MILMMMILLSGLDNLLRDKEELTRWYILHTFGNLIVTIVAFPKLIALLFNPIRHIQTPIRSDDSNWIVVIIHLYHLIFFKCSLEDRLHHLLFVGIGTISHVSVNWGYISPAYNFFVCGFPGMIDYACLAMYKENIIKKRTRVKIALELNMWLRAPGLMFLAALMWIHSTIHSVTYFDNVCTFIGFFVSIINGQYYSRQVSLYAGKKFEMV